MKKEYKIGFGALLLMACGQAWAMSLDDTPAYQKEYDLYLQDLGIIEQTGKAPENPDLEADLAKMDSNERIRLTASRFSSSSSLSFAQMKEQIIRNDAEVLSKVEIIRVPEEFRDMYADIYRLQLEQFEGMLTKEEQEALNRLRGGSNFDVAEHENPFKEVSSQTDIAAPASSDAADPMVNAYFSSNRAFVSGSPIVVSGSEYTPRQDYDSRGNSASSFVNPFTGGGNTSTSTVRVNTGNSTTRTTKKRGASSKTPSLRRNMFVD